MVSATATWGVLQAISTAGRTPDLVTPPYTFNARSTCFVSPPDLASIRRVLPIAGFCLVALVATLFSQVVWTVPLAANRHVAELGRQPTEFWIETGLTLLLAGSSLYLFRRLSTMTGKPTSSPVGGEPATPRRAD